MDRRVGLFGLAVTVAGIALGLAHAAGQSSSARLVHPGEVTDRASGAPLWATVIAWPAGTRTAPDGHCETADAPPLAATETDPASGTFSVAIPEEQRLYAVVACANGYFPARQLFLPNDTDGFPVLPKPIGLWPVDVSAATAQYRTEVIAAATTAANELAYLRSVDPEQFDAALGVLAEAIAPGDEFSAKALQSLGFVAGNWAMTSECC
jgi:hypothetical protein